MKCEKLYISYGYDELYPKEEYETTEDFFYIKQVGNCNFEEMVFYPNMGDRFKFKFKLNEEFEVVHDITVGLPVYIMVTK